MTSSDYFIGSSGKRYAYDEIAERIRNEAPHTLGEHIFVQLNALDLLDEMQRGSTPCGLPYTFASGPRQVQKELTSNGLVHTPGLFRALQNDYRIKGRLRRRATQILSDVYGLPTVEAEGLLSGKIAVEIDEDAGTVTYVTVVER